MKPSYFGIFGRSPQVPLSANVAFVHNLMKELADFDPALGAWLEKGISSERAVSLDFSEDGVRNLLLQGTN